MTLHVKDATTWKEVDALSVKDAGTWKTVTNGYVKDGGTWKEFYSSSSPPSYYYTITASGDSGSGTSLYGGSWEVSPTVGGNPFCSFDYFSSDPPGFWQGDTGGGGGDWSGALWSFSKTASAGTLVTLTYRISFQADNGTAEPVYVSFYHQF